MDERLLIEATEELLDGWCGPVVVEWHSGHQEVKPSMTATDWNGPGVFAKYLDLSRAECRDRVARVTCGDPRGPSRRIYCGRSARAGRPMGVFVRWFDGSVWYEGGDWWDGGQGHSPDRFAPALADLDPTDGSRLPDGSRLVDALALAAVLREVTRD